ncbi:MAG: T9SS type A sorting domain-containing protein [Phaeodactylibacter sp.]|nr:T9SS type A sorting domain-containing protein [Phaeodactylibacter sp.]
MKFQLLIVGLYISIAGIAQPTFHNTYDLTNGAGENAFEIFPVEDGVYVDCGTWCSEDFKYCTILFKINNSGDSLWHKQYDHELDVFAILDYALDSNEEFLYGCGRIQDEDSLPFIAKMNTLGDTLWLKTYYAPFWDSAVEIEQDNNGNLITAVQGGSSGEFSDCTIIKTDEAGEMLWSTTIEDSIDFTTVGQLAILNDGSIMLSLYSDTEWVASGRVYHVAKLSSDGEVEWVKTYDEVDNTNDYPALIAPYPGGDFITGWAFDTIGQPISLPGSGPLLRKCDIDGEILWEYKYLYRRGAELRNMTVAENGDIILCGMGGEVLIQGDAETAWMARVSGDGELIWKRYYQGLNVPSDTQPFNAVAETSDGGIIACGYMQDLGITPIPDPDVWLVKTDADGCITPGCQDSILYVSIEEIPGTGETALKEVFFKAYPNPARGPIQVEFFNTISYEAPELRLFNLQGQQVLHQRLQRGAQSAALSTQGLPSGQYVLQYSAAGRVLQQEQVVKVE